VRKEVLVRDIDAAAVFKLVLGSGTGHVIEPAYLRR
jgi:hypothetical protein